MKTKHLLLATVTLLTLVTGFLFTKYPTAQASPPQATKKGWWIRVNTSKTEATSISFQIGTKEKDREDWRTWHSNEPTEFDVPDKYLQVQRLYIHATANPNGRNAWFCMMYRNQGVKHMDFDDNEDQEKSQTDSDGECQ